VQNVFSFSRIAVTVEAIEFRDPQPEPGQEGTERGARIELKLLEPQPARGSIYASDDVLIGRALWRADLLESANNPGARDRMHFHPVMTDSEPGERVFDPALSADPIGWLRERLQSVPQILQDNDLTDIDGYRDDMEQLRQHIDEVMSAAEARLSEARTFG